MFLKDFPPVLLREATVAAYLKDLIWWSPNREDKISNFVTLCLNMDNGFFRSAVLYKVGADAIGATYSHYTDADHHFTLSVAMYLDDRNEYKVYFCRNNKWNETNLNNAESTYRLVNYLFGRLQDNAELWV